MAIYNESIRSFRKDVLRVPIEEFSREVQTSVRIREMENDSMIYGDEIVKISKAYGVSCDYLLGISNYRFSFE